MKRRVSIQWRIKRKPLNTMKQLTIIILPNLVYSLLWVQVARRSAFIGEDVFFPFPAAAAIQITTAETQNPAYTGSGSYKQTAGSLTAALRDEITRRRKWNNRDHGPEVMPKAELSGRRQKRLRWATTQSEPLCPHILFFIDGWWGRNRRWIASVSEANFDPRFDAAAQLKILK